VGRGQRASVDKAKGLRQAAAGQGQRQRRATKDKGVQDGRARPLCRLATLCGAAPPRPRQLLRPRRPGRHPKPNPTDKESLLFLKNNTPNPSSNFPTPSEEREEGYSEL